ncbi:MAG: hypothetical protein VW600_18265, partial [Ferrovibrio sp.]
VFQQAHQGCTDQFGLQHAFCSPTRTIQRCTGLQPSKGNLRLLATVAAVEVLFCHSLPIINSP